MKVLIIGVEQSPSCQIIIVQPFRYLEKQGLCSFEVRLHKQVTKSMIASFDMVVFLRSIDPEALRCLEWAHQLGKRTVYVIDDHFLAIPATTRLGTHYAKPKHRKTVIQFLKKAQTIKVDSAVLFNDIHKHFNSNVTYFPGSVDFSIMDHLTKPQRNDGKIIIGYEGGEKDGSFKPVVPALKKIFNEYGDKVSLEFFGYLPDGLKQHPRVVHVNHDDDYRRFMRRLYQSVWDIGLAPLEDSLFFQCKTNVKYRDYAACFIPGIYSLSPVYNDCVIHKETGYLVPQTEEGWYSGLKELIEKPEMRQKIKENAGMAVRKDFTLELCSENWRNHILKI